MKTLPSQEGIKIHACMRECMQYMHIRSEYSGFRELAKWKMQFTDAYIYTHIRIRDKV